MQNTYIKCCALIIRRSAQCIFKIFHFLMRRSFGMWKFYGEIVVGCKPWPVKPYFGRGGGKFAPPAGFLNIAQKPLGLGS